MQNTIYRLKTGQVWSVAKAKFLENTEKEQALASGDVIDLISAEGRSDVQYLAETLEFYGLPLGELAEKIPAAILRELDKLDAIYLTPRTLAGLARGNDQVAQANWLAHEVKAEPLRQKYRELTGIDPSPRASELDEDDEEVSNGDASNQGDDPVVVSSLI